MCFWALLIQKSTFFTNEALNWKSARQIFSFGSSELETNMVKLSDGYLAQILSICKHQKRWKWTLSAASERQSWKKADFELEYSISPQFFKSMEIKTRWSVGLFETPNTLRNLFGSTRSSLEWFDDIWKKKRFFSDFGSQNSNFLNVFMQFLCVFGHCLHKNQLFSKTKP